MSYGTILVVVVILAACYIYLSQKYEGRAIFTDPYIPGVPVAPAPDAGFPFGHMRGAMRGMPTRLERMLENQEKGLLGDVWQATIPWRNVISTINVADVEHILRDPYTYVKGEVFHKNLWDLLGDGIFNTDGDIWKVQRKTASNIFNVRNFRDVYADVFIRESVRLGDHLRSAAEQNAVVDLQDLFLRSTLDSFCEIAFSRNIGAMDMKNASVVRGKYSMRTVPFMEAFDTTNAILTRRGLNPWWQLLEKINGTEKRVQNYVKIMDDLARDVIDQKDRARREGKASNLKMDLLDLFSQTTNEDGSELTFKQKRDVIMNFVIAGRDTTAQTLSWVFWRLAQNPDIEAKLREEIRRVLGPKGEPTYDSMKDLKYTQAVFNETLRLHANVPGNRKEVTRDDVLPGTKTPVKKGHVVTISPWVMGYSKRIWGEDAAVFRPERWIAEDGTLKKENQFKWPVFNAGPRLCLGLNMATQEACVFICNIIRHFHLELVNEDDPKHWGDYATKQGRYGVALTLVMREGVEFKVHPLKA